MGMDMHARVRACLAMRTKTTNSTPSTVNQVASRVDGLDNPLLDRAHFDGECGDDGNVVRAVVLYHTRAHRACERKRGKRLAAFLPS